MSDHGRVKNDTDAALDLLRAAGPRRDASPDREARVTAAVRAYWSQSMEMRRRRRRFWRVAALAAAAALVAAVILPRFTKPVGPVELAIVEVMVGDVRVGTLDSLQPPPLGTGLKRGAAVETGENGLVALRLADGGSMRLDTGSRIILEDRGNVRLDRGAVYIDSGSASTDHKPLAIVTARGRIHELGTQFEVRLLPDLLRVRVREGRVAMRWRETEGEVDAGQQALMNAGGELDLGPVSPNDPGWSWLLEVAPAFELEGASAAAYLRWVERETGLELHWADRQLAAAAEEMLLHGDTAGLRPNDTLAVVLPTCGLTHEVDQGTLIVRSSSR